MVYRYSIGGFAGLAIVMAGLVGCTSPTKPSAMNHAVTIRTSDCESPTPEDWPPGFQIPSWYKPDQLPIDRSKMFAIDAHVLELDSWDVLDDLKRRFQLQKLTDNHMVTISGYKARGLMSDILTSNKGSLLFAPTFQIFVGQSDETRSNSEFSELPAEIIAVAQSIRLHTRDTIRFHAQGNIGTTTNVPSGHRLPCWSVSTSWAARAKPEWQVRLADSEYPNVPRLLICRVASGDPSQHKVAEADFNRETPAVLPHSSNVSDD